MMIQSVMPEADLRTDPRPASSATPYQDDLAAENVSLRLLLAQAEIDAQSLLATAGIDARERSRMAGRCGRKADTPTHSSDDSHRPEQVDRSLANVKGREPRIEGRQHEQRQQRRRDQASDDHGG
jgi:hypothetical protein